MPADFPQVVWGSALVDVCRHLAQLAKLEDLGNGRDWTTEWLVPKDARSTARVVSRGDGIVAGLPTLAIVAEVFGADVTCEAHIEDGEPVSLSQAVAVLHGSAADMLTVERTMLNFLGRLSGIATLTRRYVDLVAGSKACIYDTRKTLPGWRLLEKYAVARGGGHNHRLSLSDAVMIKDNHVALANCRNMSIADAIARVRELMTLEQAGLAIVVEVDRLDQLPAVLAEGPEIVLLDNMSPKQLETAVAMRNAASPEVLLEASGGVNLDTVALIAATGVDRISVGALTHSAVNFDFGLDWGN